MFAAREWAGQTVAILASGPSLTDAQIETARAAQAAGRARIVAINNTWRRAPFADALYASDAAWWRHYRPAFTGERWSRSMAAPEFGARYCPGIAGDRLSTDPARIHFGGFSGFQAVNLAFLLGAAKIVLAGFDCAPAGALSHWHGDHPRGLNNPGPANFAAWCAVLDPAAADLAAQGVEPVNSTIGGALQAWPRQPLEEALR